MQKVLVTNHADGTTVIAMFKDVITASGGTVTQKYVEQATLIHEAAHALGLVNNGLPMVATHHDSAHGAHCDNSNCVMYYLNEGTSDLATFVATYILSGSAVMFDDKCLNDARTYKP